MEETMGTLERKVMEVRIYTQEEGEGLDKEWLKYMDRTWDTAVKLLASFMNAKAKELNREYGCGIEVKIEGEESVGTPDPEDEPKKLNAQKCPALVFIHDSWVAHVKK